MQTAVGSSTRAVLWQHFASKAEAIGASVQRSRSEAAAAEAILTTASAPTSTASVAEHFPHLASCFANTGNPDASDVVAVGLFAIAETGSVVVAESDADRGACFLAEHLWLVVGADRIVPTLDTALVQVRDMVVAGNHYVTLMSGPSRTADIERTLTIGVHGPRALTIVIVGKDTM